MFDKGKVDKAMEYLTNLMIQYVEDEKVTKKLPNKIILHLDNF